MFVENIDIYPLDRFKFSVREISNNLNIHFVILLSLFTKSLPTNMFGVLDPQRNLDLAVWNLFGYTNLVFECEVLLTPEPKPCCIHVAFIKSLSFQLIIRLKKKSISYPDKTLEKI